ncbi:hypothetical protein GALL_321720 [mine drainage metagenome]|uniref:Uncharacterized protein n=1 Tax=mine drainage metagenome TaxID=410659 RepID=A0A1J5R200_9ZZZZ
MAVTHAEVTVRKAACVCSGEEVGAGFERTESERESNRARSGAEVGDRRHRQNGPQPRVVSRNSEMKMPNR